MASKGCRGRRSSRLMQDFKEASGIPCAPALSPRLSTAEGRNPAERRCLFGELMGVIDGLTLAVQPGDGRDEKPQKTFCLSRSPSAYEQIDTAPRHV